MNTPYPFMDGDVLVIGPEAFVSFDGSVLCWRGENYVPQRPSAGNATIDVLKEAPRS